MFERFTRSARAAVVLAQEEARDLGSDEIGPEYLLVGVLQSAGHELATALSGFGLTAEAVRARLTEVNSGATARDDDAVGDDAVDDAAADDASNDDAFEDDAEALRAIGIDLRAVRDAVTQGFGADAFDNALRNSGRRRRRRGHLPFTRPAKKALELALREALAHKDKELGSAHLLLGILRGGDRTAVGLITEHVDQAQLRATVIALLDKAA